MTTRLLVREPRAFRGGLTAIQQDALLKRNAVGLTTLPASAVSVVPTGDISSSNVQSALVELDTEKASLADVSAHLYLVTDGGKAILDIIDGTLVHDLSEALS